jgi:hypothetical protein
MSQCADHRRGRLVGGPLLGRKIARHTRPILDNGLSQIATDLTSPPRYFSRYFFFGGLGISRARKRTRDLWFLLFRLLGAAAMLSNVAGGVRSVAALDCVQGASADFVRVFGCGNMGFLLLSAILHLQKIWTAHFEVFAVTPTHSRNFTHLWKIKASQCAVMLRCAVTVCRSWTK